MASSGSPADSVPGAVEPAAGANTSEQHCPICLEDFEDKSFIDTCFHVFCFSCIVQWAEVASSCPLCKTQFHSVIHNVRANDDYEKFEIKPRATPSHQEISLNEARRFRYRTTGRSGSQQRRQRDSRKPAVDARRRLIYSTRLRALPLETTDGKHARVRNISASFFRENPACTHRLVPWLSREFKVLLGKEHVDFMIQIVMSLIDKVDLESVEFAHHLEPFLHEKSAHFMHEFISFAKSPFDMIAYDSRVRYQWPGSRPPDSWDPEATQQLHTESPGPSGLSDMQRRILEELTTTRWDDSPPLLTSNSSPILIHGSDSDQDDQEQALSPFHTTTQLSTHTTVPSSVHTTIQPMVRPTAQPSAQPPSQPSSLPSSQPSSLPSGQPSSLLSDQPSGQPSPQPSSLPSGQPSVLPPSLPSSQPSSLPSSQPSSLPSSQPSSLPSGQPPSLPSGHPPSLPSGQPSPHTLLASGDSSTGVGPSTRTREDAVIDAVMSRDTDDVEEAVCEPSVNVGSSRGPNRSEVSSTTADPTLSAEVTTTEVIEPSTATTSQPQGGGQRSSEDEYAVSVHSESVGDLDLGESGGFMLELHDKSSLLVGTGPQEHWNEREEHGKRKMSDSKHSCGYSLAESGQRKHRVHHKSRERKRIQDRRHRSDSDDSDDHRGKRRRRKYDSCDCCHRRRHGCSRNHGHCFQEGYYGNHDYERHTESYHASGSFYQRKKEHHRSRLYSDDYPQASGYHAGPRVSSESGAGHSDSDGPGEPRRKRSGSSQPPRRGSQSFEEKRRQRYRSEERETPHHRSRLKSEVRKVTEECLTQKKLAKELNDLDVEIKENKKELLKSLLRRERLELLHRSLHGEQLHGERGQSAQEQVQMCVEADQALSNSSTGKMVQELSNLDQAIWDGKKQLLRVLRRMEEEKAEEESMDSS